MATVSAAPEASADQPTRWDLSNVYSGLEGDDYRQAVQQLETDLQALEKFFAAHQVGRLAGPSTASAESLAETLAEVLARGNALARLAETLDSFVYAFVSTNSYDAVAAREQSRLEILGVRRQKLGVRLRGWLGSLSPRLNELLPLRPAFSLHQYFLESEARRSRYLMSEAEEALAAELTLSGGQAFGNLQGKLTSQLKVPFEVDGQVTDTPITVVHNACFSPDAALRKRGYDAELKGWSSIRTAIAACLNGVKGTALTLSRLRGRGSVLEESLEQNHIDQATLDALLGAIREYLPMFRRYLRAKAKKLGQTQLPWWDLFAPLGAAHQHFSWNEARQFIIDKFSSFSPDLGAFAAKAFDQRWIDGAPRDGKRGGAFCMEVVGVDESRVLANFDGSFEQVSTLAHELGHAYHNECQKGLEPFLRGAPMTLAETASIFCETLIAEAALQTADKDSQLMILEAQLAGATQVCVDISSRFQFESAFLAQRAKSELSPDEICELLTSAQRDTYGDGLDPATYHPYMWLWKPHYYSYQANFYNYPYAFGHLFGLGLYAIFRQEGPAFVPRMQELLRETNQADSAPLAARFGLDIRSRDFWRGSLEIVSSQVDRYEKL